MMDIIRCDEQDYLIWKWRPAGNEVNSTNKENAIRWGSSLRVKDGEVAAFVYKQKDGSMQDFISGPHDETIKTANFPVLSSIVGLGSTVQALPPVDNKVDTSSNNSNVNPSEEAYTGTQFSCVSQGKGNVATVGQRPGGQPIPVIIWTSQASKYFGDKYNPQERCQIVTKKLGQAVANSGGSLKDVVLMTGRSDKNTVICVISANDTGCNKKKYSVYSQARKR